MGKFSLSILALTLSLYIVCGALTVAATKTFIEDSCTTTTYPELCIKSLSAYATTIKESPRQLAQTALGLSLARAQSAQKFVLQLARTKGLKKREYEAVKDCLEEMGDTIDRLSKSVRELKSMGAARGNDFIWHMSNVETWVSAALTDDNTCMDGFAGRALDGKIKDSVRARVTNLAQVTSNALALVNNFAAKH